MWTYLVHVSKILSSAQGIRLKCLRTTAMESYRLYIICSK